MIARRLSMMLLLFLPLPLRAQTKDLWPMVNMTGTLRAALTLGSPESGSLTDTWHYNGTAGERIRLSVTPIGFNARTMVFGPTEGAVLGTITTASKAQGRLELKLTQAGTYRIVVASEAGGKAGAEYRILLETAPGGPGHYLLRGDTVTGAIEASDPSHRDADGRTIHTDTWKYFGSGGDRILVRFEPKDEAAEIIVSVGNGQAQREMRVLGTETPAGTEARLEITLPQRGDYRIDVRSPLRSATAARYTLALERYQFALGAHAPTATYPTRMITAGWNHTCALFEDYSPPTLELASSVRCWGNNQHGQLGDATGIAERAEPRVVTGLASGVVSVAAGTRYTCAVMVDGAVKCWGDNRSGVLGDGTNVSRAVPMAVAGLAGAKSLATASDHACAVTATGGAKCWGVNLYGQLGDGTGTNRLTPVDVAGLSGVVAMSAGQNHTCALLKSGAVKCWGFNGFGEVGDSTARNSSTPVQVRGLTAGVKAISSGGRHSCALMIGGEVRCWGSNSSGQIEPEIKQRNYDAPIVVPGLKGVRALATGRNYSCGLLELAGVVCWGSNQFGQLNGVPEKITAMVEVVGVPTTTVTISAGELHTCTETALGHTRCWGGGSRSALGDASMALRTTPPDTLLARASAAFGHGNVDEGVRLIQSAVNMGHPEATYIYAEMHLYGTGVAKDEAAAARLFRIGAERGHRPSKIMMAALYIRGAGVPRDVQKGLDMMRALIDAGDASAANIAEGLQVIRIAAEAGFAAAAHFLAWIYDKGEVVPQNPNEAFRILKRAADGGHAESQHMLAKRYLEGHGVTANRDSAIALFFRAMSGGHRAAEGELERLAAREVAMWQCAATALETRFRYPRSYMSFQDFMKRKPVFVRNRGTSSQPSGDYFQIEGVRPGSSSIMELNSGFRVIATGFTGITTGVENDMQIVRFNSTRASSEEARSIALSIENSCRNAAAQTK